MADNFVNAVTVGVPLTTAIVSGLATSTFYAFQVYATNATGSGAMSGIVATSTHALGPNPPAGLGAAAGTPAETVMVLTWTASPIDGSHDAAAAYTAYYRQTGASSFLPASPGWISGTSAMVTGLMAGTSYDFEVVASNWGGAAVSGVVTAVTSARVPNLPAGLTAGTLLAVTTSSIAVSWSASPADGSHDPPTSYTLRYRVTSGGAWTQVTGITGTTQTVTGLLPGTSYDFQVEAVNAGGASGFTPTANGTTYAVTITLNYVSPSPFPHGGFPGVNATVTPTPTNVREAWGSSATVEPTSGWTNGSNYSGSLWGCYLGGGSSATAGTAWLWLEAQNNGGATIGLLVTGPYAVT